jgi:hypothetical protein
MYSNHSKMVINILLELTINHKNPKFTRFVIKLRTSLTSTF